MTNDRRAAKAALSRRVALGGLGAIAASLAVRNVIAAHPVAAAASSALDEGASSIQRYRKVLCGDVGEDVLWWFTGDFYIIEPNASAIPIGRPMTVGVYRAIGGGNQDFRYRFREAGVILDVATGEPLRVSPLTHEAIETPLVHEEERTIEWLANPDGSIGVTNGTRHSTLHTRWTLTRESALLLETEPSLNAFGVVPGASGSGWTSLESTRTVYAKRRDLERARFVPASMIYSVSLKLTPSWLGLHDNKDRWILVRGLGVKSRAREIVNADTLRLVKQFFPAEFFPR